MKILVSNDDGVNAPGIKHLYEAMKPIASKLTVVAPDRNRSAASNSLTLENPLRITKLDNGFLSVNGTPTDCVHVAITGYLDERPDMVVSGINSHSNLGDDVLYSGTVAAAIEGRFLGLPAVAVSLAQGEPNGDEETAHYATAAKCIHQIIAHLKANPLPKDTILNVNVPNIPFEKIKGVKVAKLGYRHCAEKIIRAKDARGYEIFWVGAPGMGVDIGSQTDFNVVEQGYVAVTPLKTDLTDHHALTNIDEWLGKESILK